MPSIHLERQLGLSDLMVSLLTWLNKAVMVWDWKPRKPPTLSQRSFLTVADVSLIWFCSLTRRCKQISDFCPFYGHRCNWWCGLPDPTSFPKCLALSFYLTVKWCWDWAVTFLNWNIIFQIKMKIGMELMSPSSRKTSESSSRHQTAIHILCSAHNNPVLYKDSITRCENIAWCYDPLFKAFTLVLAFSSAYTAPELCRTNFAQLNECSQTYGGLFSL